MSLSPSLYLIPDQHLRGSGGGGRDGVVTDGVEVPTGHARWGKVGTVSYFSGKAHGEGRQVWQRQVPVLRRLLVLCASSHSYNPFEGPNENPEAELPLTAGEYIYVYGSMDEDGFFEGIKAARGHSVPSSAVGLLCPFDVPSVQVQGGETGGLSPGEGVACEL